MLHVKKSDVNVSVDSDCGIGDTVLSCSLHAVDNDDVRFGSNLAQLESANLLVELIGSSHTEIQHPKQKEYCNEDRENQGALMPCTNDITEAVTAKCIESGVVLLPAEGSENVKDDQLNSNLKSAQAIRSGRNCNNTSDDGSAAGIVCEQDSPGFTSPKDFPSDHYLRHELLDDFSVEKSREGSAISGRKNVYNSGAVGNPSFDSAMSEHKSVLSEDIVHIMNNYVGTCPSNSKKLIMELQSIFPKENIEQSVNNDLTVPISGHRGDESTVVEQKNVGTCPSSPKELLMELQSMSPKENIEESDRDDLAIPVSELRGDESNIVEQEKNFGTCPSSPNKELIMELQSMSPKENIQESDRDDLAAPVSGLVGDESTVVERQKNFGTCPSSPKKLLMELQSMPPKENEEESDRDYLSVPVSGLRGDESSIVEKEKNVASCPSSPKESLMELQSVSPKENIENSDRDNLAISIAGLRGDDSTIVEQHIKVDSCSNRSQLESNDFVDELILCSNTEVLHQGHNNRCNGESTEEQVVSEHCIYDAAEAPTVKYKENEVDMLQIEETSELQVRQLNSILESAKVAESSLSCGKDIRNISDNESSGTVVYEKFLFGDNSDSRVNTMNNYVGTCTSNLSELLMELQSFDETIEDLDPRDNLALPNIERDREESTICLAENLADTVVSSESDVCLGPSQDLSRDEGKQSCMSVSQHDDEEGFVKPNHLKDTPAYLSEDTYNIERDVITEEVLSEETKRREPIRSSNCDILHENSHSKRYGVCQSSGWIPIDEINSKLLSCDAEVLRQDLVVECQELNEVTPAVLDNDMSGAAPSKIMESKQMLDREGEEYSFSYDKNKGKNVSTGSAFPDEQLSAKLEGAEMEQHDCVTDKDTGSLVDTELAGKNKASNLPSDTQLDSSSEYNIPNAAQQDPFSDRNFPNHLSAPRSPEKSTAFQQ